MKATLILIALPLLMSCQRNPDRPTAEEARQLDDASNLLNEAPANLNSVDDSALKSAQSVEGDSRP